jgi:uncharacterized protein
VSKTNWTILKITTALLSIALFLNFLSLNANAEDPKTLIPTGYVTDNAGILTQTTKEKIEAQNLKWKSTETAPEVAVVTIKDVGNYGDVDNFSDYLVRQSDWKIGDSKLNNGVLILFAQNNGKNNVRISTGYGAEGVLPDISTFQILQKHLSDLKSADPVRENQGISDVFDDVAKQVDTIAGKQKDIVQDDDSLNTLILVIVLIVLFMIIFRNGGNGGYTGLATSGVWVNGWGGARNTRPGPISGSGWLGGGDSSGGGFGGFGGGGFGGGGSSV